MPCYHPLTAYYANEVNRSGKRSLVFKREASLSGVGFKIGCGRCIGCRLERARQWAMRCMHEARLHVDNCFLTLTYNDENVPGNGSVSKRELQLFMKRLRKARGNGIRFFGCGEYGGESARPHYHLLLFNCAFPDKKFFKFARGGERLYFSGLVDCLWPLGFNVIGDVSFDSCSYVARYVCDKITGDGAEAHYGGREPEFVLMSRRPGLGTGWFERYGEETYNMDSVVFKHRLMMPPRFYDSKVDVEKLAVLKRVRRRKALLSRSDSTVDRLRVREEVTARNLDRMRRDL